MARICIVAHFAFGAMTGGDHGHTGGVERQTSIMARWLAAQGHAVSLVTWDEGQADGERVAGVRMLKLCRRDDGLPGLRFFHPRWTSLDRALARADARIYYQNCAEVVTGQVAWWCRRNGRCFVYSVASDPECDPRLPELRTRRERCLYRYGLRHAERIIVQTRAQKRRLREAFGLDSVVLPMPCPAPSEPESRHFSDNRNGEFRVAWVGRIAPVKRLEMLLDAAGLLPGIHFDVAGPADSEAAYMGPLLERARRLGNVALHGRISRERMPDFYSRASMLCCTSAYEGFPNTFLEAWSYGLPIVSTVDPDDLLAERGVGLPAAGPAELASAITRLQQDRRLYRRISAAARGYFGELHAVEPAMRRFERIFMDADGAREVVH